MAPLWIAIQFLTRIPVRLRAAPTPQQLGRSLAMYPLVGAIIGILLWLGAATLTDLGPFLRAALLICLWVALTGALHLDGLADTADACAGAHGHPQRAAEILKDPRCGAMGVVAVVMVLLLKFAALAQLPGEPDLYTCLMPPILARAAVVALFLTTPYVSRGGLGAGLSDPRARPANLGALGLAVLSALLPGPGIGMWLLLAALVTFVSASWTLRGRFGGANGDGAGALVETTEAAVLVALVATSAPIPAEIQL